MCSSNFLGVSDGPNVMGIVEPVRKKLVFFGRRAMHLNQQVSSGKTADHGWCEKIQLASVDITKNKCIPFSCQFQESIAAAPATNRHESGNAVQIGQLTA